MAVNCRKCIFFKITWERNFKYACKVFGFKSQNIPSIEIINAAGKECPKFSAKNLTPVRR